MYCNPVVVVCDVADVEAVTVGSASFEETLTSHSKERHHNDRSECASLKWPRFESL